ncbi:helix-turn-helix domain-containing protein [Anaerotruncus colihominis]|uniref:helix-turn-helix domain-containing protein n=1 Tax=Anaerotruncus colihominis TaxID=169435 RepID=UPI00210EA0FD|nr:helix-turn-helix transcriptional regulator [Anaerotruncus colihominis]MCQ4735732.1 helix-turn-helix domain-containing protein [Anaerotruncus colihominis]
MDKHLSQEEMAFRIDLSVTSYAEIERAQVHANLEILDYISRATGLSPAAANEVTYTFLFGYDSLTDFPSINDGQIRC